MSKPKPAKVKRAEVKTAGEGASECDSGPSHVSDSPAKNIFQCDDSVSAILGEEAILQWDGDGDERYKAALRKAAQLPANAELGERKWMSEMAKIRLKKAGVSLDAPDYQQRLAEIVKTIEHSHSALQKERADEGILRAECEKLEAEYQMIVNHWEAQDPKEKSPVPLHKLRPFPQSTRRALLERYNDPKQHCEVIRERLLQLGVTNGEKCQIEATEAYIIAARDWLSITIKWTAKRLNARRTELEEQMAEIRGRLAQGVHLGSSGLGMGTKLFFVRLFNYEIADEIAKAEPLGAGKNRDRDQLRAFLRLLGESCATKANAQWMDAARTLHKKCGDDFAASKSILDPLLRAFVMPDKTRHFPPTTWQTGDAVDIPSKFYSGVARFVWQITDPVRLKKEGTAAAQHHRKVKHWQQECAAIRRGSPRAKLPQCPMHPTTKEEEKWDVVDELKIRGWKWEPIAERLVELGLGEIELTGGENEPELQRKADRDDAIQALARKLCLEWHRLTKAHGMIPD